MPLDYILDNRLRICRHYNITDSDISKWEFWRFQTTIDKIVKSQQDKENKNNINAENTFRNI